MCVRLALPQVVNIVSNDVRRFDDALPFYNFLICSPGERALAQGRRPAPVPQLANAAVM